jgi:hypothetical protein
MWEEGRAQWRRRWGGGGAEEVGGEIRRGGEREGEGRGRMNKNKW